MTRYDFFLSKIINDIALTQQMIDVSDSSAMKISSRAGYILIAINGENLIKFVTQDNNQDLLANAQSLVSSAYESISYGTKKLMEAASIVSALEEEATTYTQDKICEMESK
jgi:indole-3-glycerol phosphate synthase